MASTKSERPPRGSNRRRAADTEITQPRLGLRGWLRFGWRQLTSMRTALMLLMLLAVAAIPGSLWPQRRVDPVAVNQFINDNPDIAPLLDRLSLFDVFDSPWFAAIYLLLVISLVGCIVPRSKQHFQALRAAVPATPRRLSRLPEHRTVSFAAEPEQVESALRTVLRRRRMRVAAPDPARPGEVAAEGGYLKETGNILFHLSVLGVTVAFAAGHLLGWRGEMIVVEGQPFVSHVARYDTMEAGAWVSQDDIPPFVITLDSFISEFETGTEGGQFGAPRMFRAELSVRESPEADAEQRGIEVNQPLFLDGASIYLMGNGYAPVVTIRDGEGEVIFSDAVPFLTRDDNYTSTGAIKVTAVEPQLGFYGAFLPTLRYDSELGPTSDFPALIDPALVLGVYEGDLFPGDRPQSVYTLDVSGMTALQNEDGEQTRIELRPGQTSQLPDGRGSITLEEVVRWVGLVARDDPGRMPALVFAGLLLAGLIAMLAVRRRRVFARITPSDDQTTAAGERSGAGPEPGQRHTEVEIGALAKGTDPGLGAGLDDLIDRLREELGEQHGSLSLPQRQKDKDTR